MRPESALESAIDDVILARDDLISAARDIAKLVRGDLKRAIREYDRARERLIALKAERRRTDVVGAAS